MSSTLHLSQYKLRQFLTCQRRFQLRYQAELLWPASPPAAAQAQAVARGAAFHQLLARHFLGLPVEIPAEAHDLAAWWQTFREQGPELPAGQLWPEASLTVPIGAHLLTGRFDLVVFNPDDGSTQIFDWKTERKPRSAAMLANAWQTRLYLALIRRGGHALAGSPAPLEPTRIALTYWFVNEPSATVTFTYDRARDHQTWAELEAIVAQIEARLATAADWPLTEDWNACGRCPYQVFCGRQSTAAEPTDVDEEDWAPEPASDSLEPEWQ